MVDAAGAGDVADVGHGFLGAFGGPAGGGEGGEEEVLVYAWSGRCVSEVFDSWIYIVSPRTGSAYLVGVRDAHMFC